VADGGFDRWLALVPAGALVAVLVAGGPRGAASPNSGLAEQALEQLREECTAKVFPCLSWSDGSTIMVKSLAQRRPPPAGAKAAAAAGVAAGAATVGAPKYKAGLLVKRHSARTGMVLFFGNGNLVHAVREIRSLRDARVKIGQARSSLDNGRTLPIDFQF
jgi:hypothetical protein